MKKLGILAVIFVAVLAWKVSNYGKPPGPQKLSKSDIRQIERNMDSIIREHKRELPQQIAPYMTWTDMRAVGKDIQYVYVIDMDKVAVPVSDIVDQINSNGKAESLKTMNADPQTKSFMDAGFTFHFIYRDKIGKTLTEYSVGKE